MSRMLWLCWDGGGNLNPSLGVARVLRERGHEITFVGRPEMLPRVQAAGFDAIELKKAGELIEAYPPGPQRSVGAYLTSPRVGEEVAQVVSARRPDLALIDAMFPAALSEAGGFHCPTAVMLHTFFNRMEAGWKGMSDRLNGMRQQAGFAALPALHDLWTKQDRIIVNALEALDQPAVASGKGKVRHAGPVLEQETRAIPVELPWNEKDTAPLVLVSFSTVTEQRLLDSWKRTLAALEPLPVHVIATTGGLVDPSELSIPGNAHVVRFASHEALMKRASMVVTHGGHGTAMRALSHGLPMVLMPALAADQPVVAASVQEWGAGTALPSDAGVDAIRAAVSRVLGTPSFRTNAGRIQSMLAGVDGAARSASWVEELLKDGR